MQHQRSASMASPKDGGTRVSVVVCQVSGTEVDRISEKLGEAEGRAKRMAQ